MKLTRTIAAPAAIALAVSIGGCSAGPELKVPIAATASDQHAVVRTHAFLVKNGIAVWGEVLGSNHMSARNYIHVEALSQRGAVLAKADIRPPVMMRHNALSQGFNTNLAVDDVAAVARLFVEVRPRPDMR